MSVVWGKITVGRILEPIRGKLVSGAPETVLQGITTDSRKTAGGELFCALRGEHFDGHAFVFHALKRGAAAILLEDRFWNKDGAETKKNGLGALQHANRAVITVEDTLTALGDLAAWWRQQHQVKVAAITGSTGKTTTKEMTAHILSLGAETVKNQGNFNNLIGMPLTLFRLDHGTRRVVLEMGMNRPGEIGRLTRIADPDVGVITNVGMAHLEGVGGLEGVLRAKVEMAANISSRGTMILNGDDERLMNAAGVYGRETVTVGLGENNDVRASHIRNRGLDGVSFDLHHRDAILPVKLSVPGVHNIRNAAAAAAVGFCFKVPHTQIVQGLAQFGGVKGRCNLMRLSGSITVMDDTYNSNPLSLKAALSSGAELADTGKKMIVCLGEMMELGDVGKKAHFEAGKQTARVGTRLFFALGEQAPEMVRGALSEGMSSNNAAAVADHGEMVRRVAESAENGDLILIKGSRKMQMEQVVEGLKQFIGAVESSFTA